jgi:hypothetical protein
MTYCQYKAVPVPIDLRDGREISPALGCSRDTVREVWDGLSVSGSHRNAAAAWCPGYSLARTLRLSPSRIGDIVLERRGVTADTALRLARGADLVRSCAML